MDQFVVSDSTLSTLSDGNLSGVLPDGLAALLCVAKTGQEFQFSTTRMRIGRDSSNNVPIPSDTFASREHALITFEDGRFWLQDLGSTNGTLLNGRPVTKRLALSPGDTVTVGRTEVVFKVKQS